MQSIACMYVAVAVAVAVVPFLICLLLREALSLYEREDKKCEEYLSY
jgi:hypothetical protein